MRCKLLFLLGLLLIANPAAGREWKLANESTIVGKYLGRIGEQIVILTEDNNAKSIALSRLSKQDRAYAKFVAKPNPVHLWTNGMGDLILAGDFVKLDGENVLIRKLTGKEASIPLKLFSDKDRKFVALQVKRMTFGRVWLNEMGKQIARAELVGINSGYFGRVTNKFVHLELWDGTSISVPLEGLSEKDRELVAEFAKFYGRRIWFDADRRRIAYAILVEVDGKRAVLQRWNGERLTVPLDRLSEANREYVVERYGFKGHSWIDKAGKTVAQAEFINVHGENVILKEEDGKKVSIRLNRLSEKDRSVVTDYMRLSGDWRLTAVTFDGQEGEPTVVTSFFGLPDDFLVRIIGSHAEVGTLEDGEFVSLTGEPAVYFNLKSSGVVLAGDGAASGYTLNENSLTLYLSAEKEKKLGLVFKRITK